MDGDIDMLHGCMQREIKAAGPVPISFIDDCNQLTCV
jgi:hypothetical protein